MFILSFFGIADRSAWYTKMDLPNTPSILHTKAAIDELLKATYPINAILSSYWIV